MKSIVRFRHRSIEDLPDCAGPMTARISLRKTSKEIPWRTSFPAKARRRSRTSISFVAPVAAHHFFRPLSQILTTIAVAFTRRTEPRRTTAVA